MRIHRVYSRQSLEPGQEVSIFGDRAHYLRRVLRVKPGQTLVLFNGDGHDYVTEVLRPGKKKLVLSVRSRLPAVKESGLEVTVVQAISRGERMVQTLQKCTELGASGFQPLFSERVEVRLSAEKLARRLEHWQNVVIAACEQCGRAVVPPVHEPLKLDEWLALDTGCRRIALAPGAGQALAAMDLAGPLELLVGPEGGFSDLEMDRLSTGNVLLAELGPRTLRTETAAPTAVAILQALGGDLR